MDERAETSNGAESQHVTMDPSLSASSLDRPALAEDAAAMTIEFLRARLLSERAVSKAAREQAQLLAKKVTELERQLESEVQLRIQVEASRMELLSKYRAELFTQYSKFFITESEGDAGEETSATFMEHDKAFGESFPQAIQAEEDEDMVVDGIESRDSSRKNSFLEDVDKIGVNYDDENGREKGGLAWGRRKGAKKQPEREWGYGPELFVRSSALRSPVSTDGESPHKRWAGKSVRQSRKKEIRVRDTYSEEDLGRAQDLQVMESLSKGMEDERDAEVQRVLERQAELIEQFEAEENAQRAWEEKFREQNAASYEGKASLLQGLKEGSAMMKSVEEQQKQGESTVNAQDGLTSSIHQSDAEEQRKQEKSIVNALPQDDLMSHVHQIDLCIHASGVMAKEDGENDGQLRSEINACQESSIQNNTHESKKMVEVDGRVNSGCGYMDQTLAGDFSSQGAPGKVKESCASMGSMIRDESCTTDSVGSDNLRLDDKHVLTSLQLEVDADTEIGTSLQVHADDVKKIVQPVETMKEQEVWTGQALTVVAVDSNHKALSESRQIESHPPDKGTDDGNGQVENQTSLGSSVQSEAARRKEMFETQVSAITSKDVLNAYAVRESDTQAKEKMTTYESFKEENALKTPLEEQALVISSDSSGIGISSNGVEQNPMLDVQQGSTQRSRSRSSWEGKSGLPDRDSSRGSSEHLSRDVSEEEMLRRRSKSEEMGQDQNFGRPRQMFDLPPHALHSDPYMRHAHYGPVNRDNMPSLPSRPDYFANPPHSNPYEGASFVQPGKSLDGSFERVAEVLRVLEIAKHQVQNSNDDMAGVNVTYRSGHDGRDAYYMEPSFPFGYSNPPLLGRTAPFSSRGFRPFVPDVGAQSGGMSYARGLPRQPPSTAAYGAYTSRIAIPQNFWPSQGAPDGYLQPPRDRK